MPHTAQPSPPQILCPLEMISSSSWTWFYSWFDIWCCPRFLRSSHTPSSGGNSSQNIQNINFESRSDDLLCLHWFWWLLWEGKALVELLEEPSTSRIYCQCTLLSSLPILEQQNQSSASRGPLGWELLKIPLLLLNVSSLGGNTSAALCVERGIDDMWSAKKTGKKRTTEQPSEISMQISYWINWVSKNIYFGHQQKSTWPDSPLGLV